MSDIDGDVGERVFFWSTAAALHHLFLLHLQLLEFTALLDAGEVSTQQRIHVFESGDLFVAETARADADAQTERTNTVLSDVLVGICVFQATETVLPPADVLVIYLISSVVRILA